MAITRYSPWTQNHRFQDEMKQVFDRFFGEDEGDQSNVVTSQWTPRVDIKEEDKRFVILADIPGVDPNDIEFLEEMILDAVKQAVAQGKALAQSEMSRITGGLEGLL